MQFLTSWQQHDSKKLVGKVTGNKEELEEYFAAN